MPTTFGIEEEFALLDPLDLSTVDLGREAVAALRSQVTGAVAREFLPSQVEYATPICSTFAEAQEALMAFRRTLGCWAADAGVVAAGCGTPFRTRPDAPISSGARYARIAADVGGLTGEHQINGLHVHVGIPDRDSGIRASNALRPWLPVLLALSGNSPFWHGRDTGFDSWRAIHLRRWTTHSIPPRFRDADDYDRTMAALTGIGATSDPGTVNWDVRLSSTFPTLEVRVCDAQLDAMSSLALSVTVRALVDSGSTGDTAATDVSLDAALWHAARYGVGTTLVRPATGRLAPAGSVLRALYDHIAPFLHGRDEMRVVKALLDRQKNGANLQRAVSRTGAGALAALYRERLANTQTSSC